MADAAARPAEDFVIATGVQYSVRQFVEFAAKELGISLAFEGEGEAEVGRVTAVALIVNAKGERECSRNAKWAT